MIKLDDHDNVVRFYAREVRSAAAKACVINWLAVAAAPSPSIALPHRRCVMTFVRVCVVPVRCACTCARVCVCLSVCDPRARVLIRSGATLCTSLWSGAPSPWRTRWAKPNPAATDCCDARLLLLRLRLLEEPSPPPPPPPPRRHRTPALSQRLPAATHDAPPPPPCAGCWCPRLRMRRGGFCGSWWWAWPTST